MQKLINFKYLPITFYCESRCVINLPKSNQLNKIFNQIIK